MDGVEPDVRVLFTCIQGYGHFHPLVPLALALQQAGHEVAFATAERFAKRIEEAGFQVFAAGRDLGLAYEEAMRSLEVSGAPNDSWVLGAHLFARVAAPAKAADLASVLDNWAADLLIHDPTDFAGPIAAARAGIPYANHSFGALARPEFTQLAAELVAPAWREFGMVPMELGGMYQYLYLDVCPPSFQASHIDDIPAAHPLRPAPFDTTHVRDLPAWVRALPDLPTVYVTLGTVDNHAPGVFETVLDGLGGQPMNVVATVGPSRDPADLGHQPDNIRIERYLPHSLLFPQCDVVATHGGSGTTLAALAHGLPLLVMPQGANQFWNAERCEDLGVGLRLFPAELNAEAVRHHVSALLAESSYREKAGRLQHEISQMPPPEAAVELLEQLRRYRQPLDNTAQRDSAELGCNYARAASSSNEAASPQVETSM